MERRYIIGFIGGIGFGTMFGYYVGAKKLLGIQSEEENVSVPETVTPTQTPSATQTATPAQEVIDDFEDGDVEEWRTREGRDSDLFSVTDRAAHGTYAGRLAFKAHVWRPFERSTPSELRFWLRTDAVSDNELKIVFLDASGEEWASNDEAAFGVELGAENQKGVFLNPPFPNGEQYPVLYDQPEVDTWYQVRLTGIDFDGGRFDAALYDQSGAELGRVDGHRIANDRNAINRIQIKNAMNHSGAAAAIDQFEQA